MLGDDIKGYWSDDIQGDVLPGFRGRAHEVFHQRFLLASITGDIEEAREGLRKLTKVISTGGEVTSYRAEKRTPVFVNVAFTAAGLGRFGFAIHNEAFTAGLAGRSVTKSLIGDPSGWQIGGPESDVDVLINIGSTESELVKTMVDAVLDRLGSGYQLVEDVAGALLPQGREHFGFHDGLAQPFVAADRAAAAPARDGMPPADAEVWPNWAALRLEGAAKRAAADVEAAKGVLAAASTARPSPAQTLSAEQHLQQAIAARDAAKLAAENARQAADQESRNRVAVRHGGTPIRPAEQFVVSGGDGHDEFTANGSYMVWLKLEQRPAEFWSMCRKLAWRHRQRYLSGLDEEGAAALLVGRHLDGTPLQPRPAGRPEAFGYFTDPFGRTCPAGAHIRLTNPRDVETAEAMVLRRGIPYGPPAPDREVDDGQERGLIFICYQADIERQYERIQGLFANADYSLGQPVNRFPDAIISQRGREGRSVEIADPAGHGSLGMRLLNTWVVPRGGLYLFVPSMVALRMLAAAPAGS